MPYLTETRPGSLSESHFEFMRLMRRMALSPSPMREDIRVTHTITPTIDFDRYFVNHKVIASAEVAVAENGVDILQTVTDGEIWSVFSMELIHNTGSFVIDDLIFRDDSESTQIRLSVTDISSGQHVVPIYTPLVMEQKDSLRITVKSFSSSGAASIVLWAGVSTAF